MATPTRKTPKRPLEQRWLSEANELYMRFNMLPGYDRPTLMEYVAIALRDAYERGQAGEEFEGYVHTPEPVESTVIRRSRPATIEVEAPLRIKRSRH